MPTNSPRVTPKKTESQPLVSAAPAPPEASVEVPLVSAAPAPPSSIDSPESNNIPEEGILCVHVYVLFTKMDC